MHPIQELRLLLATQMETLTEAHAQLREAHGFEGNDPIVLDCLREARQSLDTLVDDVGVIATQIDNLITTMTPPAARKTLGLRLTR